MPNAIFKTLKKKSFPLVILIENIYSFTYPMLKTAFPTHMHETEKLHIR